MSFEQQDLVTEMDRLYKFAMKLCRSEHDAEDLLQATVLKALEKKDMFKEGSNLFSWVSTIMYNDFVSSYRRKVKFESKFDCEDIIKNQSVAPSQATLSELSEVNEAMEQLSEKHRTILIYVCVKGLKYKEVAKLLSIPVGTVRSRLSRAREQLEEIMAQKTVDTSQGQRPALPSVPAILAKAA